jgi:hypothetical protein
MRYTHMRWPPESANKCWRVRSGRRANVLETPTPLPCGQQSSIANPGRPFAAINLWKAGEGTKGRTIGSSPNSRGYATNSTKTSKGQDPGPPARLSRRLCEHRFHGPPLPRSNDAPRGRQIIHG